MTVEPEPSPPIAMPGVPGMPDMPGMPDRLHGLSGKLLALTVAFVMVAEVLIFAPSIATMRLNWLRSHLNKAAAASVVIDSLQPLELPRNVQNDTLLATGTRAIALRKDGTARMLAVSELPQTVDAQYDLAAVGTLASVRDALDTLVFGGDRMISVSMPVDDTDMTVEVVMADAPLHKAMLQYSIRVALISLLISVISGLLLYATLNRVLISPLRRVTRNLQDYAEAPDDPARIIRPGAGRDELAFMTRHLAIMQAQMQKTLRQQKNLADLGLAVSKINHDMRNILASAQLMSDRLVDVDDPLVKSVAPRLVRTIDRAVGYTNEVLAYGQTSEAEPRRRRVALAVISQEVRDSLALDADIELVDQIDPDLEIDADREQVFRVLHNLCRNAVQALSGLSGQASQAGISSAPGAPGGAPGRVTLSAQRIGSVVAITVDDNGPGMARKARENLFTAFRGSARSGGTGLGLAIAREIVLAHGGTIALVEKPGPGTQFRIEIPDQPVALDSFRPRERNWKP